MICNTIDLNRAERAVSSLPNYQQQEYHHRKLQSRYHPRYNYLPLYPAKALGSNHLLLLPNVPVTRLPPLEILRRQHGAYTEDALLLVNNYQYSTDGFSLSPQDAEELAARLQVGMSILTYNADRLRGISDFLMALIIGNNIQNLYQIIRIYLMMNLKIY